MSSQRSNYVDFAMVKQQVNITEVLKRYDLYDDLKKTSSGFEGYCPFCDGESNRAFKVSQEKNCFNCFNCRTGGNVLDFVKEFEECTVREAACKLADWFDLQEKEPPKAKKARPRSQKRAARKTASSKASKRPLGFELELDADHESLVDLGLEGETIREFGLGYCAKGVLQGCIAFPVYDSSHHLMGYAGYDPEKEKLDEYPWRFPKQLDRTSLVFNSSRVDPTGEGELILVPDPLEAVFKWQDGERRVVSLMDATLSKAQVTILESLV